MRVFYNFIDTKVNATCYDLITGVLQFLVKVSPNRLITLIRTSLTPAEGWQRNKCDV